MCTSRRSRFRDLLVKAELKTWRYLIGYLKFPCGVANLMVLVGIEGVVSELFSRESSSSMAGIASPTALYFASNVGTGRLTAASWAGKSVSGNQIRRRSLRITAEVRFVDAEEAKQLIAVEGYSVVDVRDKTQFERAHIKSCHHIPLFIFNEDNDLGTIIKRTVHNNFSGLFFGLPFTKLNPEFVSSVKNEFSPDSKLLVVCQEGLRSTAAANRLEEAGFENIACVTSGLQSVKPGTFDSVGSTELQNAGKAGLITVQGKISAVLGTVLVCAYLFLTLFPDQAEKLFPRP